MLDSLVRVSRRVLKVPKAVASPTGIIILLASPRTPSTNSWQGPVTALDPHSRETLAALATGRTQFVCLRPDTLRVPPGSRSGERRSAPRNAVKRTRDRLPTVP